MAQIKLKVGDFVRLYRKDKGSWWPVGYVVQVEIPDWDQDTTCAVLKDHRGAIHILLKSCIAHVK